MFHHWCFEIQTFHFQSLNFFLLELEQFFDSYSGANERLTIAQYTSNVGTDSDEFEVEKGGSRKRRLPARYTMEYTKKIKTPMPNYDSTPGSTSRLPEVVLPTSSDEEPISTPKTHQIPKLPEYLHSGSAKSAQANEIRELKSLVYQSRKLQEKLVIKLNTLEKKVDVMNADIAGMKEVVLKDSNCLESSRIYEDFISEFDLPAKNNEELIAFNQRLTENKELQSKLTRHLQLTSVGKNVFSFLTSVLKKLLIKNLAMQYSRIGRKGKKSFTSLGALYQAVLAAVLMRFQNLTACDIDGKLGRALALSADWNGREAKL